MREIINLALSAGCLKQEEKTVRQGHNYKLKVKSPFFHLLHPSSVGSRTICDAKFPSVMGIVMFFTLIVFELYQNVHKLLKTE